MKAFNFILAIIVLAGCSQIEPRRPINPQPSTTIFSETVDEAKKLRVLEEKRIQNYLETDSTNTYISSENGFWYRYDTKINEVKAQPKAGDTIQFSYVIKTLDDALIYDESTLGTQTYIVDKQDFITGIQKGVKLMKEGETVTFIFPSSVAYGTSGDGDKVGLYQTIKSTITLLKIN